MAGISAIKVARNEALTKAQVKTFGPFRVDQGRDKINGSTSIQAQLDGDGTVKLEVLTALDEVFAPLLQPTPITSSLTKTTPLHQSFDVPVTLMFWIRATEMNVAAVSKLHIYVGIS